MRDVVKTQSNQYVAVDTKNTLDCGWETMVFDCCEDGYIFNWGELELKRYPDEESAIKGHKIMVEKWKKMNDLVFSSKDIAIFSTDKEIKETVDHLKETKEIVDHLYNYTTDVVPPNLSSEYFNTLTQEEKEKAWRDWGERCGKIVQSIVEELADYYKNYSEEIFMPKIQAIPDPDNGGFAFQVGNVFDVYWRRGSKYYLQREGEPVWHEISELNYQKAYEEYCRLSMLNNK